MQVRRRFWRFVLLAALLLLAAPPPPVSYPIAYAQTDWGKMPLPFVANQGQMDAQVAYYVQGSDKTLYFTPEGLTLALTSAESRWVLKLDFVGANAVQPIGQDQTTARISYFRGPRDEWHTELPTFSRIVYPDLWEGIDLIYSGTFDQLKYEFVVQPGADPARIRLAYRGASVRLNEAGQLELTAPAGGLQDDAPVAYQVVDGQRAPVAAAYALDDTAQSGADGSGSYGFRVGAYDPTLPLVIDPAMLFYAGYIGGSGTDRGYGIAVDAAGNAYVAGEAWWSPTFPVTVGPDLSYNGGERDAFVAKVAADGSGLIYCGYIGGSWIDFGQGIAVDAAGNAYVTGIVGSAEASFPATIGPDLTFNGGGSDAFVAKVAADGTDLVYAGYIGGNDVDLGLGVAVDTAGNAYITGYTKSTEATFPVVVGPDLSYNDDTNTYGDAFVAKVAANGSGLVYAGYIGGKWTDRGNGIAVDTAGNAYVTGETQSTETTFPMAIGPDLTYNGGGYDAFVAKVAADGAGLVYGGFVGGSGWDYGNGIAVDTAGNAYVTGYTDSTEATFPVAVGPDLTYNGGNADAFVAKVAADGTGLTYAGYIGGSGDADYGNGIAVDKAGNAYIAGETDSTEATFPVVAGPDLTHNGGSADAFVAKVAADGTGLAYAGYIGGSGGWDYGHAIAVDASGNAYIAGETNSTEATFPVMGGPDLTHNGGSTDAFVAKIFCPDRELLLPITRR